MPAGQTTTTPDQQQTVPPLQEQSPQVVKGTVSNDQPDDSAGQGLSITEALEEALTIGPRAAAVRAQLAIAKSGIAQATITPNPVFFMDRGFVAEAVERRGPSITWDPPIKLALRMMAAKRLYDQNKIDLLTTLWQLRADTRRAYTEAIVAKETRKTLTDLYELTNRLLTVSSKRFQAGDVPELDVLRARLATSQSKVDLGVGDQRVVRATQQLNVVMGRNVEAPLEVPALPDFTRRRTSSFQLKAIKRGILPDFTATVPPLQLFLKIALDNRLELKSLAKQIKVNDLNYKNALANVIPNPSIAYGSSTSANLPSGPKLRANFMTLNIECPVTNLNQGDRAKFRAIGKQLLYQVAAQKNQVIADVSSAYNNLLASREKIRVYQEHVLADSAEVARLSRRSYEVGQSDINSTLLAQQANVQIRGQYLDAVTSFQGAFTDLEQACGAPLMPPLRNKIKFGTAVAANFDGEVRATTIGGMALPSGSVSLSGNAIEIDAVPDWLFDKRAVLSGIVFNHQVVTTGVKPKVTGQAYFLKGEWLNEFGRNIQDEIVTAKDGTEFSGHVRGAKGATLDLQLNDGNSKSLPIDSILSIVSPRSYSFEISTEALRIDPTDNSYNGDATDIRFTPNVFHSRVAFLPQKSKVPRSTLAGTEGGINNKTLAMFAVNDVMINTVANVIAIPIVFGRPIPLITRQLLFFSGNASDGQPLYSPQVWANGTVHFYPTK